VDPAMMVRLNYFRKRLLLSFLVLLSSPPFFYFLSTLPAAREHGVEIFFVSLLLIILCLAYISWFYFSDGKRYSEDFDKLRLDPKEIAKWGWTIPEKEWGAFTLELLQEHDSEARTSAARDFKSCGYWIVMLAFAPIVLLSLLAAYWGYWGALWMVPVPLFFMWVANINTLRIVAPTHNRRQIRRWQKLAGSRFVFGNQGFILGEDYFPLVGSLFWYDNANVIEKENGRFILEIRTLQRLKQGKIFSHRTYQVSVPQANVEKARGLANFISLQGRLLTQRMDPGHVPLSGGDKGE
jgi:hypothetical protein